MNSKLSPERQKKADELGVRADKGVRQMNSKLSPERQKKADELGLPYEWNEDPDYISDFDGNIIAEPYTENAHDKLKAMMDAANRVLQLEQAVEELRRMLEKCQLRDAAGFTWIRHTRQQSENFYNKRR